MAEEKFELERNRGWRHGMPIDHEDLAICGVCSDIVLEGATSIVVLHKSEKKNDVPRVWKLSLCDDHRRLLCTCSTCAAFDVQVDDPDLDEGEEPDTDDDEAFSTFCLRSHEDKETLPEKWCLEWRQGAIIEATEIEELLNTEEEEDDDSD